eukprot:m.357570 g.357570  ORF g.357570 m.357570 type:complete len:150 (+) comp17869_c0_seq1:50-499(+)
MSRLLLLAATLVVALGHMCHAHATMTRVEDDFDAKPNGQQSTAAVSMETDDGLVTCTFTYAVVGGTNEQWMIAIEKEDNDFRCVIERPGQKTYLFFMHFQVELSGATITDAQIMDNNGPIDSNQFNINGAVVTSSDDFANAVAHLEVYF